MFSNKYFVLIIFSLLTIQAQSQELQAKVTVQSQRINSSVDKKIFVTLQNQLTNLLNNRKWTADNYGQEEKIACSFLITITDAPETDVYKASLTIQATRPVYNSSYQSATINFQDANFSFKYVEFQPVEFNENRIAGTDPLTGNLTAVMAYYVYLILGIDYDSFSPKGGLLYFQKAQNIVNNAPESRSIAGWSSFDGQRNRYWLINNFNNVKYNVIHDVIYDYYRSGLDNMYDNATQAHKNVLKSLEKLQIFNQENPNTMIFQFIMQGKSQEMLSIFKKAAQDDKQKARDLLSLLDVANINLYKQELK